MYSEWSSLVDDIRDKELNSLDNVLKAYPTNVGKEVVKLVLKALNIIHSTKELPVSDTVTLTTPQQVEWSMGVIGYGLSLPLTEHDLMHLCIDTYEMWLSVVYDTKSTIPGPVREEPDLYIQVMFRQLCQVFNERPETVPSTGPSSNSHVQLMLENQALLCNRVLRLWHYAVIQSTTKMSHESWDCLLNSLLRVANIVLAPPVEPNSLATNLKTLPVHVLFEAWLLASVHAFPRPQLWKSLCELCHHWRHHRCLSNQWTRLIYTLTFKVIGHLYTANYLHEIEPSPIRLDQNFLRIVEQMSYDIMVQCWYRILHILGDPVELAYPEGIANLPAFKKYALEREEGQRYRLPQLAPTQASLAGLPLIYYELMRGVATLIYLFLGRDVVWDEGEENGRGGGSEVRGKGGSGLQRNNSKDSKSQHGGASRHKLGQTNWYVVHSLISSTASPRTLPTTSFHYSSSAGIPREASRTTTNLMTVVGEISKPQGNTLLQLFGSWLFRAAIWPDDEIIHADSSRRKSTNVLIGSLTDLSSSLFSIQKVAHDLEYLLRYEKGRAEAFGALCSIFSSQHCGEPFLPIYLAKFYRALILGLHYSPETSHGHILTEIMLHSYGLLRKDLKGINIVMPYFLDALALILPRVFPPFKCLVDLQELRCASIDLLLSMISLPLHFLNQPLPNVFSIPDLQASVPTHRCPSFSERGEEPLTPEKDWEPLTFLSLQDHLVHLLLNAIVYEKGHTNMQVLLHALNVVICDIVVYDSAVSKLAPEESPEDHEVFSITLDQAGGNMHNDMPTHSRHSSEYSPSMLVNKAILICRTCLNPPEGEDTPVQVSLAALELLSSVARLPPDTCNHSDSRYAVLIVSSFIESQAMKELPRHNRDLHTSIVAAFSTLTTLILAHPYLMGSKESMSCVMKVIELGISGRFSTNMDGSVTYKGHKKAKPISGRVKEIAEFMLYLVMENIYAFPSPCGAESSSSLLSEDDILARLRPEQNDQAKFQYFLLDNSVLLGLLEEPFTNPDDANGNGRHTSPHPTVTAVVRSPSGKHVWSMQLQYHPRSYQPSTDHRCSARRPIPKPHPPVPNSTVKRKPWPDEVNFGPSLKLDLSLPSLDDILDSNTRVFHEEMLQLTSQQVQLEKIMCEDFYNKLDCLPFPNPKTAMEPPLVQEKFNTARLFLNHLSLLGIEGVKEVSGRCQPLVMLNSSHPKFSKSLTALDGLPSRFCNTIFVLHCKVGVTKPEDILASHSSLSNKPAEFLAFLHNLGWMVNPTHHPGFAGKIHPPKMENASSSSSSAHPVGISAQIPARPFPYYTDSVTELAFIVPELNQVAEDSSASLRSAESSDSGQDLALSVFQVQGTVSMPSQQTKLHPSSPMLHSLVPGTPPGYRPPGHESPSFRPLATTSTTPSTPTTPSATYMNMDLLTSKTTPTGSGVCESSASAEGYSNYPRVPSHQRKKQLTKAEYYLGGGAGGEPTRRKLPHQDCAAMIVWLERFEDHHNFPVDVLSKLLHSVSPSYLGSHKSPFSSTRRSLPVIFIHKMASGLYQIITKNSGGRPDTLAGPLTDGMVVSRRSLNILARQTVINMCNRHRMENDGFSPPHVKRKKKMEEMAHTYKQSLTVADFYTQLFTNKS